ncbi:YrhB domain-containing protein [Paraconexibacter sp. AEG42_29]|uniref:YrhB domain-containing protein n=1 Tax=Paraconexibacter sp. AEG42_29 TaxID=2997339 RepID=UPI00339D3BBC
MEAAQDKASFVVGREPSADAGSTFTGMMRAWDSGAVTITFEAARALAELALEPVRGPDLDLIVSDEMTEELTEGWVFFWDDRRHVEGDEDFALGGGGPIFVARSGDPVHMVWSGESWETAVARYRATGSFARAW